jgi:hypothetical protein
MLILERLTTFDLEKKYSVLILIGIIAVWAGISGYQELTFPYEDCGSFGKRAEIGIGICTDYGMRLYYLYRYDDRGIQPTRALGLGLIKLSDDIFGEYRIIPFISSGLLLGIVYLFTVQVAKRNYSGLIAVLFLLHSAIFYKYDLTITYPTFWAVFLFGSLYLCHTRMGLMSPLVLLAGVPAKIINIINAPMLVGYVLFSDIPKERKKNILYGVIAIVGIVIGLIILSYFIVPSLYYQILFFVNVQSQFDLEDFLWWLGMWSLQLYTDKISLFMIFILLPVLFIMKKEKVANSGAILFMLIVTILQSAFVVGFTKYTVEDYRFLHMVILIGVGLALAVPNMDKIVIGFQKYFTIQPKSKEKSNGLEK